MRSDHYRVTLDLDDATDIDALRGYFGLRDAGAVDVEIRVSSSGDGFHVRGWFDGQPVAETVEKLRLAHGDHPKRVHLDKTHDIKPAQMLFTFKESNEGEAGPWRAGPFDAIDDKRDWNGIGP